MSLYELSIPESLQFYYQNSANQNAIDQILALSSSKKKGDGDLNWNEIESFNMARVAALKTQADYWSFVDKMWGLTWGQVVGDTNEYSEIPLAEYENERSLENVWEEGYYRRFNSNNGQLYLGCYCSEDSSIGLSFYVENKSGTYDVSNELELSDSWCEPKDDERSTKEGMVKLRGNSMVSLMPFKNLAVEAIHKLEEK